MQYVCGRMSRAALYKKEPGSRLPAAASCLGRHAHPAGRSPNSSSLFLPLAAVVAAAQGLFSPPDCSAGRCCSNPPLSPLCKCDKTETPVPIGYRSSWWARVDCASRAAKNSPLGCFCAVFCDSAAAVRIHPCFPFVNAIKQKLRYPLDTGVLGGRGWIRTTEAESSRFTVCPHWPLGNTPIFIFTVAWTACICYH